ncbi:MAG: efflux RND transporter periplasmic adaptor subunit [Balneolaceae bacterium]|nr:efflux RND transporter periplasmic adaptor subunit [Balneolaceae bacterium]MBO6545986.1 efflux RND transporter periplasmic adaptor subunit [Balneolaceae bacterium]MBO6647382.1 efflux RND transporter periplasmic adaptor subunit [Balneolaceae bacterium]
MKNLFFTALFITIILSGCGNSDSNQSSSQGGGWASGGFGAQSRVTSVETQNVAFSSIADQVRSFGTIKAQDVIVITPQVSNRITRFYVDLGDTVRQGQILAKIYDATYRDQLNQAKAQLEQSKIAMQRDSSQFDRQKILLERELISESEYDIAFATFRNSLAQFESAKAQLTQAQENFNFTEVRSPVRGVIISRTGEEGDIATTGQALFEVANLVGYETRIYLPVQDWRFVKIGQPVKLRVSNEAEATAEGVVSRKSPQLDATTGLGEVVITLTQVGNSIYPGVLTENVIDIVNKPRAIVIPRSALVEKVETVVDPESNTIQLDRTYSVFVSQGDSVAELRALELGIEQGDRLEVLSGLRPGEQIVVTGQQSLQDGGRIRVATGSTFSSPEQSLTDGQSSAPQRGVGQGGNRPGRAAFANMSDEERQKMQTRMQNMSQEERRTLMDSIRTANSSSE